MRNNFFQIDFSIWAEYWDLIENHGLNNEVFKIIQPFLTSEVLVIGSGQGLFSKVLNDNGFLTENIDKNFKMAEWAKSRRNISTTFRDIIDFESPKTYNTVVISTGIINQQSLATELGKTIIEKAISFLKPGGNLILTYFRQTKWTEIANQLGLYGRNSNNFLFWQAGGNLNKASELFQENGTDPSSIENIFKNHHSILEKHQQQILAVGHRHLEINGTPPDQFLKQNSGYYPFSLSPEEEKLLFNKLSTLASENLFNGLINNEDTRVIVMKG